MQLGKGLKKSSGLHSLNKALAIFISMAMVFAPVAAIADPIINDVPLPPASFTFVEDRDTLLQIQLDPGPAWCYDVHANSVLITAPARERARCELRLQYEQEKHKVKCDFKVKNLELRIKTLNDQLTQINKIKDAEIDRLTEIVKDSPADNSVWWATGGFLTGVLITVGIVFATR